MSRYVVFANGGISDADPMRDLAGTSDCIIEACAIAMQSFPKFKSGGADIYDMSINEIVFCSGWWPESRQPSVDLGDMPAEDAMLFRIKFAGEFKERKVAL